MGTSSEELNRQKQISENEISGAGYKAPGQGYEGPADEMSIYDGGGNESVVVMTNDADGRRAQGTGPTREEALKDAQKNDTLLGDDFNPSHQKASPTK